jgi:hypothetical protein
VDSSGHRPVLTSPTIAALCVLLYAGLSVAVLVDARWLGFLYQRLPRWAVLVYVTAIGPAIFLVHGIATWKFYVGSLLAIAACLALAWLAWRQWPDSEFFAVGLVAAGALWAGCGWLALAASW